MSDIGPEAFDNGHRFLKELDEELAASGGQTIAWLSVENQVVSWRLPGPHVTEDRYFFNVGVLPAEPKLEVLDGASKIPVDQAVRVNFWNPLDDPLSWEMDLSDILGRGISNPERVHRPEILARESGVIVVWSGTKSGFV